MKTAFCAFLTIILLLASVPDSARQTVKPKMPIEQSAFSLELPFERTVKIPDSVLDVLENDSHVLSAPCHGDLSSSTLEAAEVHLIKNSEPAMLIKGKGCLLGANMGPFWIFRSAGDNKFQEILSVDALVIKVCTDESKGYRNISAGAVVGGGKPVFILFKFAGTTYQEVESADDTKKCR
jgi:hypothetical protein